MSIREGRKLAGEGGIVLVFAAMIVVAILGAAAMIIHYGYLTSMHAELQSAADTAAVAAAIQLNSTKSGWGDAKEAVAKSLSALSATSSVGGDTSLAIPAENDSNVWDLASTKNLRVRIDRGIFVSPRSFFSLEPEALEESSFGPPFVIANAVRVGIQRPTTTIFGSPWGGVPTYEVTTVATAVRGPTDPVCVAPFALPICSLVDETGEFMGPKICRGDRLFTRVDRYCRPGVPGYPDCKAFPSSPYTPVSFAAPTYPEGGEPGASYLGTSVDSVYNPLVDPPVTYRDLLMKLKPTIYNSDIPITTHYAGPSTCASESWGFGRRQAFPSATDHYGVVGLPGNIPSGRSLEGEVLRVISGGAANAVSCVDARIGDQFNVLRDGLTSKQAEEDLWSIINNDGNLADTNPQKYVGISSTLLGTIEERVENIEWLAFKNSDGEFYHRQCKTDHRYKGACNSRRGQYRLTSPASENSWGLYFSTYSFKVNNGGVGVDMRDSSTVWKVKIPVIAEKGQTLVSCQGVSPGPNLPPSLRDPDIDPAKVYLIVGFVEVLIYDVDIGNDPPDYEIGTVDGQGTEPFPEQLRFQERCNNVRARITCSTKYVPSSSAVQYEIPRLVNSTDSLTGF